MTLVNNHENKITPKFHYDWTLGSANFTKDKGKVFSCFSCGGGSTMGYKLAGFDVVGCNEIDPKMMSIYVENHKPKYPFLESIVDFKKRKELPAELYDLDILDGSPPCSSFSMAGNREKDWGKEKKFREGQKLQVLDTLFFDFIELAKRLRPKVVIAENVKGILLGAAKKYVIEIKKQFDSAGYYVKHFLLNSSKMGVPQKRERVFFVAFRKDLALPHLERVDLFTISPKLDLNFNQKEILFGEIYDGKGDPITDYKKKAWLHRKLSDKGISDSKKWANMKVSDFNHVYTFKDKVMNTITGKGELAMSLFDEPKRVSVTEMIKGSTFPNDYNFLDVKPGYVMGMSVPPVMVANIASRIYKQWLS